MSALPMPNEARETPGVEPIWPNWTPQKHVLGNRLFLLPSPDRYPYLYRKLEASPGVWVYGLRDKLTGTPDEQIAKLNRRIRRHRRAAVDRAIEYGRQRHADFAEGRP